MDPQDNSEPVTPSMKALEAASRRGMKPLLLVLGFSGIAVLGAEAVMNREPVEVVSQARVQKVFAAIGARHDQPAQATAESSLGAVPAPDAPAATLVEPSAAPAAPTIAERPKTVSTAPDALAGGLFAVGDRLKVAFFERVDVDEDKWGRTSSASALRSILQRPELSGEYAVQEDGTISVPLLGSIPVANRSAQQVHADLVETFEQLLGRKGLVNILSRERSPIYVLGPVKNPGSFKYVHGMTILHAIALAGGLDRGSSDSWQKIETVREIQKRSGAAGAMLKLIARMAVLKAERDGTAPKIPTQLMEMVGAGEAKSLVAEQAERRKPVLLARTERQRAVTGAVEAARQVLLRYASTESLDELVKTRQERVDSTRALVERNVLGKAVLSQVQSELSDAEQRRQDAMNQYGMAKQRLAGMEADGLKVQSDLKNDLAVEIEALERQIADNEREFNTSEGVLSSLSGARAQLATSRQGGGVTYQIVRQSVAGPVSIESNGMTVLQPGDLVNISVGEGAAAEPEPPVMPDVPPAGRAVKNRESGRSAAKE